jgi:hypothetical protein
LFSFAILKILFAASGAFETGVGLMPKLIPAEEYTVMASELLAEIGDRLVKEGKLRPEAVQDLIAHHFHFGVLRGGEFCDLDTGLSAEAAVAKMLETRPHWRIPVFTDDAEDAFGEKPTLAARATYRKEHGEDAYALERDRWGASDTNLKPGKRPEGTRADETAAVFETLKALPDGDLKKKLTAVAVAESKEQKKYSLDDKRNNPWLHLRGPDGKIDAKAQARCVDLLTSIGTKACLGLAKAAGVDLSGHPLRGN